MGFEPTTFDKPIYEEESLEPKKAFIISCEGENTEPEYFKAIENKLSEYIDVLIKIELVPKLSGTAPSNVVEDLKTYIEEKKEKYDYEQNYDEFWIVIDREKQETRKENIQKIKENEPMWKLSHFDSCYLQDALDDKIFLKTAKVINIKNHLLLKEVLEKSNLFEKHYFIRWKNCCYRYFQLRSSQ